MRKGDSSRQWRLSTSFQCTIFIHVVGSGKYKTPCVFLRIGLTIEKHTQLIHICLCALKLYIVKRYELLMGRNFQKTKIYVRRVLKKCMEANTSTEQWVRLLLEGTHKFAHYLVRSTHTQAELSYTYMYHT